MECMTPIFFAGWLAMTGQDATFHDAGAVVQGQQGGAFFWHEGLLCRASGEVL